MGKIRLYILRIIFAVGTVLTAGHALLTLRGAEVCLNQSCKVVEGFLKIDPVLMSLGGALLFGCLFIFSLFYKRPWARQSMLVLLMAAMVAEGILLSIQVFLAGQFCSYCLTILALILVASAIYDTGWFLRGLLFMSLQVLLVSKVDLGIREPGKVSLDQGTYGVKSCSTPNRLAYLIFSDSCPHCRRVLDALKGCTACEIRFNPIKEIDEGLLPGISRIEGYDPRINLLFLRLVNINAIPVLVERTNGEMKIITGDEAILEFLKELIHQHY
jgi:hypothetical protein